MSPAVWATMRRGRSPLNTDPRAVNFGQRSALNDLVRTPPDAVAVLNVVFDDANRIGPFFADSATRGARASRSFACRSAPRASANSWRSTANSDGRTDGNC